MRIGIDATFIGTEAPTGLAVYTLNLVNEIARFHGDIVIWTSKDIGFQVDPKRVQHVLKQFAFLGQSLYALRPFWMELVFPGVIRKSGADILLSTVPGGMRFTPVPHVVVVHDLTPLTYPADAPAAVRWNFRYRLPGILSRAAAVVAVSCATRDDILSHYLLAPEKVRVIGEGYDRDHFVPRFDPKVLKQYRLRENGYILAVGSANPRKNLIRLVEAFSLVHERITQDLVLAGPLSEKERDQLLERATAGGVRQRIVFPGYVPYQDLPQIYSGATLFAYPSLYEGFGLPVLEAMACGTPVLTSNVTSIPEVAGTAALLVDPTDCRAIATALEAVLNDPDKRSGLRAAGLERVKGFSWEKTAREMYALLQSSLKGG